MVGVAQSLHEPTLWQLAYGLHHEGLGRLAKRTVCSHHGF